MAVPTPADGFDVRTGEWVVLQILVVGSVYAVCIDGKRERERQRQAYLHTWLCTRESACKNTCTTYTQMYLEHLTTLA